MKNIIRILTQFSIIFLLSSCYYNSKGCLVMPQSVHCFNEETDIESYKKHISYKEKIKDLISCGAIPNEQGYYIGALVSKAKKQNLFDDYFYVKKTHVCMMKKGYVTE